MKNRNSDIKSRNFVIPFVGWLLSSSLLSLTCTELGKSSLLFIFSGTRYIHKAENHGANTKVGKGIKYITMNIPPYPICLRFIPTIIFPRPPNHPLLTVLFPLSPPFPSPRHCRPAPPLNPHSNPNPSPHPPPQKPHLLLPLPHPKRHLCPRIHLQFPA